MQCQDNEKWPRGYFGRDVGASKGVPSRALRRPCSVCHRVYCVCPRRTVGVGVYCATSGTSGSSGVQQGKGTRAPAGGGVHPPVTGWGGKSRSGRR
jgi:hypothetical protein